jgi:hypothetical protein
MVPLTIYTALKTSFKTRGRRWRISATVSGKRSRFDRVIKDIESSKVIKRAVKFKPITYETKLYLIIL